MDAVTSPALWSTVAALPDYLLLAQTRQLARHEQALQILVLDHLREIEARRLHLTRGYGSLFDYVVHELGYTAAAAWRRIKAMRLCSQTSGARELLQDGSLNLSNAAQLQNLFERSDRSRGRPPGSAGAAGGAGSAQRSDGAPGEPGEPGPAAAMRDGEHEAVPAAGPVLDAAAREELVRQAAGKSTREVQQMLAEVDPELAQPSDRMRALGGGRWELKAAVDAECRHGLEKLLMLLSHRDPHLALGGLVARLVRDGLDRYDPARPPRSRRTGGGGSVDDAGSVSTPARRATKSVARNMVSANGSDVERQNEAERDDRSRTADRVGTPRPSKPKRNAQTECDHTKSVPVRDGGRRIDAAATRYAEAEHGGTKLATERGIAHCADSAASRSEVEHGSAALVAAAGSGAYATSAAKRQSEAEPGRAVWVGGGRADSATERRTEAERVAAAVRGISGGTASAAKRHSEAEHGSDSLMGVPTSGGHTASPAKRDSGTERGSVSPAAELPVSSALTGSPAKRLSEAELGRTSRAVAQDGGGRAVSAAKQRAEDACGAAKSAAGRDSVRRSDSAPKRVTQDEGGHTEEAERVCADAASTPGRRREREHACGQPTAMRGSGGRAASPAKRQWRADGGCRDAGVGGFLDRATCAAGPRFDADRRDAVRAPGRGGRGCPASAAKRLADATGYGAVGPAERSPALERHLAALRCFDALPGSGSRYIPVAVKREVWRRDQGCCSYVDPHSGRRCGSRYRLEIDHVVPFALGGPAELSNLRIRCRAHHRLRHVHADSVATETRRAPVSTFDPEERGRTVGSHTAIERAEA